MLLSIGMMVKNEEKHLNECLESLQPILQSLNSELIIVDTGSEDNTVEIAKRYTDKVYFHEWNNNFAEMRNITINYAKGEWFFCIDGDEVLESADEIIEFFKSEEYKGYYSASMGLKNYTSSNNKKQYGLCDTIRLFKNDGDYKYKGTVHNQPIYKQPTKRILCTLEHYGYVSDDLELMEKKFIRTSNILKKELESDPENVYYRYQLAVSYSMHKDFEEALDEISLAYNKLNEYNKKSYKYIFNEYANILMCNQRFKECESLCLKELKLIEEDEPYKIDLMFFLAKSQSLQKDYRNAIDNYYRYIELLDKLEQGKLPIDLAIKVSTSSDREIAYNDIAIMEYQNRNYKEVIRCIDKINDETTFNALITLLINSLIKLEDYDEIKNRYIYIIENMSGDTRKIFERELENSKIDLKEKLNVKIEEIFSNENSISNYIILNKFRVCSDEEKKIKLYNSLVGSVDLNDEISCYGDLLYTGLKSNYNVIQLIDKLRYEKIIEFLDYCDKKYDDLSKVLFDFIKADRVYEDEITGNRINVVLCRTLLILEKVSDDDYKYIFEQYVFNGVELIKKVYSRYILDSEKVFEVKNDEHEFFIYMMKAEEYKANNQKEYIRYLRYALKSYPYMKKAIEIIIKSINEEIENKENEMLILKKALIENINKLIECNNLESAKEILAKYKELLPYDKDIYSLEAIIEIMENNIDNAIALLNKAIKYNKKDFDSLYNLAYCFELNGDVRNALRSYRKAWFYLKDQISEKELLIKIYSLEYNTDDYVELERIYTYYNQVKSFILKRLSGNKKVKFKDVVTEEKTKLSRSMKVLFAPIEIANQMNTYSAGLNSIGIESYTLNGAESYLKYESDFSYDYNNMGENQLNKIILLIAEFDVFHLFFGYSILAQYNDLDILNELNKKVVMNYWGSDIRVKSIAEKHNKYVEVKFEDEKTIINSIKKVASKVDMCIVADKELYQYVYSYFKKIEFLPAGIILDESNQECAIIDNLSNDKQITIVHAPTSKKIKGSEYIVEAVKNLKKKYNINFELVENMSNDQAKQVYAKSDIIVDQILAGTHGIFAIEAMSMGKPVVTYIADAYRDGYPEDLPIISANPDNIEKVLDELITNIEDTKLVGKKGIEYVKKYHDTSVIADKLIEIYNRV